MFNLNSLNLVKTNVRAEFVVKIRFLSNLNLKNGFTYRFSTEILHKYEICINLQTHFVRENIKTLSIFFGRI